MQFYNYLKPKMQFIGTLVMAMAMFSCGSYQYAGYETDSIYSDTEPTVEYVNNQPSSDNSQYYKNYFKEKTEQYASISDENDVIFTDIDSYESDNVVENDTLYDDSYAGWGENNSDVTINIYGGHAFNSIWWNRPYYTSWGWNYGYGYGNVWGYGFNNWGWNRPLWLDFGWGWGWNSPYWYGGGYYNNPFYCAPYFYGNNGYYNGYYSRRAVAYNQTRRGATYASNNNMGVIGRRSTVNNSNSRRTTVGELNRRSTNRRSTINSRSNRRVIGTTNSSRTRIGTTNSRTRPTTSRSNTSRTRSINTRSRSGSNRINNNNSSTRNISRSSNNRSSRSNNVSRSSSTRSSSSSSRSSSRSSTSRRGNNNL